MKILIKSTPETYLVIKNKKYLWHSCCYYPFLIYDNMKQLGHEVKFYGKEIIGDTITNDLNYDIMIWCEIPSYEWNYEFTKQTLLNFKGKNIFYIPTKYDLKEYGKYFDFIFIAEMKDYIPYYKEKYPNTIVKTIPWFSPSYELVDRDKTNPYNDKKFKIIYTGIIKDRYLKLLNKLSEMGENIYLGGTYFKNEEKLVRAFTSQEMKEIIHPNIKLISPDGTFSYGYHFNWLKYADIGINFYPAFEPLAISSKITDYLVCGLPIISEYPTPNNFRIKELNAGRIVQWNNFNSLYEAIQHEKSIHRDRNYIITNARRIFNPVSICERMIEAINE